MVLPAPAADPGAARPPAWLAQLIAQLERARRGILFALTEATPTQLGPVVRALSEVSPWTDGADGSGPELEVCLRAEQLLELEVGSRVLLRVRDEDLEWLNLYRPIFADRELRAILWVEPATLDGLVRQAVDLFDWVSRIVPVPTQALPGFALEGVRAALAAGAAFTWTGAGLDELLVASGHELPVIELNAGAAIWELVAALRESGSPSLPVMSGLRDERDAWRMRMALAWAGREGSWVARDPGQELAGMWPLHARQQDWDAAAQQLRAAGWARPELLAAWVELEPEWIEWLAAHPEAKVDEWDPQAVAYGTAPAWMRRRYTGEDAVAVLRGLLRSDDAEPPESLAGQVVWAGGRGAWDAAQAGAPAPRLVRALRELGREVPSLDLVEGANAAGFLELSAALALVRWDAQEDSRADELVLWLMDHGHVQLAFEVATAWKQRAGDDAASSAFASHWLGELHVRLGPSAAAIAELQRAIEAFRGLIASDADRLEYSRALADSLDSLGDVHEARMNSASAKRCYEEAVEIRRDLLQRQPDSEALSMLAGSLDRLGKNHTHIGDALLARLYLEEALAFARALVERVPDAVKHRLNLAVSLEALGDLLESTGEIEQAHRHFEESLTLRLSRAEQGPSSSESLRALAASYERLGNLERERGDLVRALSCYQSQLRLAESLVQREPHRVDLQHDLGLSLRKLGLTHRLRGDTDEAKRLLERSLALAREVAEATPDDAGNQWELSVALSHLGDLHEVLGDPEAALDYQLQAHLINDKVANQHPERLDIRRDRAAGRFQIGDLYEQIGDLEQARQFLRSASCEFRSLLELTPRRLALEHELAMALAQLGLLDDDPECLGEAYDLLDDLRSRGQLEPRFQALADALAEMLADSEEPPNTPT